jgi:hypothetical protein
MIKPKAVTSPSWSKGDAKVGFMVVSIMPSRCRETVRTEQLCGVGPGHGTWPPVHGAQPGHYFAGQAPMMRVANYRVAFDARAVHRDDWRATRALSRSQVAQ